MSRHKYLILLTTLVCGLIVQSIDQPAVALAVGADVLVSLAVVAVFRVVFETRRSRWIALWAGVAVVALAWLRYLLPEAVHLWLEVAQKALAMLFFGWANAVILRDVFQRGRIRTDDVIGAVGGYLLAAGAWANLYALCELLAPGSFNVSPELATQIGHWHGRSALFSYFSLATLTTVGYGDMAPVRGPLTTFAMLETVYGQFYLAVVVAQIVGMRLAQGKGGGPRVKDRSAGEGATASIAVAAAEPTLDVDRTPRL